MRVNLGLSLHAGVYLEAMPVTAFITLHFSYLFGPFWELPEVIGRTKKEARRVKTADYLKRSNKPIADFLSMEFKRQENISIVSKGNKCQPRISSPAKIYISRQTRTEFPISRLPLKCILKSVFWGEGKQFHMEGQNGERNREQNSVKDACKSKWILTIWGS